MNKKLIFATIGPSSMDQETIQKMDKSGVDIFRINLSHTKTHEFSKDGKTKLVFLNLIHFLKRIILFQKYYLKGFKVRTPNYNILR